MSQIKSNPIKKEQIEWERSLQAIKQENALLKYRLSEMVDISEGNGFLQLAEYFQNEFLRKDVMLENLIKKLHNISGQAESFSSTKAPNHVSDHQDLRAEVLQIEKDFLCLSKEFNEKISEKK